MGWSVGAESICNYNINGQNIDLLTGYGRIPIIDLVPRCENFIIGPRSQSRATQNNEMMQQCIMNSLTKASRLRIITHREDYMIADAVAAPLLFKTIMRLSVIDSKATAAHLRENLYRLPNYMVKCNSNIDQFHSYFDQTTPNSKEEAKALKIQSACCSRDMQPLKMQSLLVTCKTRKMNGSRRGLTW